MSCPRTDALDFQVEARPGEKVYRSIPHAFSTILKDEGPSALMKGSIARVVRAPSLHVSSRQLARVGAPERVLTQLRQVTSRSLTQFLPPTMTSYSARVRQHTCHPFNTVMRVSCARMSVFAVH